MIFGEKSEFAIECEPLQPIQQPIYAHFCMWVNNQPIGDYTEHVNLQACLNWLEEFMLYSDDRREPSLDNKSKEVLFQLVFDSIMVTIPKEATISDVLSNKVILPDNEPPIYKNVRERFHLDQVGMSSFSDKWNVLLIEKSDGSQRLVWRNLIDLKLHEMILPPRIFEKVAYQFIEWSRSITVT